MIPFIFAIILVWWFYYLGYQTAIENVELAAERWKAQGRSEEQIYAINNFLTGEFRKLK